MLKFEPGAKCKHYLGAFLPLAKLKITKMDSISISLRSIQFNPILFLSWIVFLPTLIFLGLAGKRFNVEVKSREIFQNDFLR